MNVRFSFFNVSSIFGGQERFASLVMMGLKERGAGVRFYGGPESLCFGSSDQYENASSHNLRVAVFNGNRALYESIFRVVRADLRVFVHHSLLYDGQATILKQYIRKFLMSIALRRIDLVVRVCDAALPESFAPGKVLTIHNGVNIPARHEKTCNPEFTLLMVGSINKNKNQEQAIRLLTNFDGVRLVLVGDGPDQKSLERLAIDLGVAHKITWAGFSSDPGCFYRQADVLLMLSRFEALPYAVLEAMSYGVPVIAYSVGGVPEIISDSKDGILLPHGSEDGLLDAISRLKADPDLRRSMGEQARLKIQSKFNLEDSVSRFLDSIVMVAKKKGVMR